MTEPERPNADEQGEITEEQIDRYRRWSSVCGVVAIVFSTLLGLLSVAFVLDTPAVPLLWLGYAIQWWPLALIATVFGIAALALGRSGLTDIHPETRNRAVMGIRLGFVTIAVVVITFVATFYALLIVFEL
jgi:hypothetical protein